MPNLFLYKISGNLELLIYFCDKTFSNSAQRIFVNYLFCSLLHKYKFFCQDFGYILAKKLCLLKNYTQINDKIFYLNWQYVLRMESRQKLVPKID